MKPRSEAELAEIITTAKAPLRIVGGGTRDIGVPVTGEVLSTQGLSGVTLYEPGALTLVAGAGTSLAEVENILKTEGQRLAFEPMDHRGLLGTQGQSTIGGVVAANVSGSRRVQVGACRDSLLGVRFVDGMGRVLKNGGRVMKNVTGYDLVKLMAGSWGTLGVLSDVSLKVQAIPETEATLVAHGLDARTAVTALAAALGSPYDLTGAAHCDTGADGQPTTYIRLEGLEASVKYRQKALQASTCAGWDVVDGDKSAGLWAHVCDVAAFEKDDGTVWRISVKPSNGPVLTEMLRLQGLVFSALYDWGGGLVWVSVQDAKDGGAAVVRATVQTLGGHATLIRATPAMRRNTAVFQPEAGGLAALTKGLRVKFDPRGILNRGLMG